MIKERIAKRALRYAASFLSRNGFHVTEERYSASYLRRYEFDIATFIDVGVYKGSPVFYQIFNGKKFVLVDPLPTTLEKAANSLKGLNYDYVQMGAGAVQGAAKLTIDGSSSSLLKRVDWKRHATETVDIEIQPLDKIIADGQYKGPFGLKIDTEGFDLDVLKGAKGTLKDTAFVFTEASIRRRFENGYRFSELVAFMADQGFEAADIIPHRAHNRLVDVLFVRRDSLSLEPNAVPVRSVSS
jgi:FkbM family methyltransferase